MQGVETAAVKRLDPGWGDLRSRLSGLGCTPFLSKAQTPSLMGAQLAAGGFARTTCWAALQRLSGPDKLTVLVNLLPDDEAICPL